MNLFYLGNNRSTYNQNYKAGLASQIWVPLNAGRYVGTDSNNTGLFKNRPNTDSIKLVDWISNQVNLGNIDTVVDISSDQTVTGEKTFDDVILGNTSVGTSFGNTSATVSGDLSTMYYELDGGSNAVELELPPIVRDGQLVIVNAIDVSSAVTVVGNTTAGDSFEGVATTATLGTLGTAMFISKLDTQEWHLALATGDVLFS